MNAIQGVQRTVDTVTHRLATGLKVNSALEDPDNFFIARALQNRAADYNKLLDGIGQSIRTVQEAVTGTEAIEKLLNQAESIALESQSHLLAGTIDGAVEEVSTLTGGDPLVNQIMARAPVAYWRLNDTTSPAINLGSGGAAINGSFAGGVSLGNPPLYNNGGAASADFDGVNDIVNIPDSALINTGTYPERTVELVFNADTTAGRQVLYEEGATVNGLTIYIDNGLIRVTGEDDGQWIDADISAPIVAGQTYHIAFVFDQPNNSFTGYLDGANMGSVTVANTVFPSHSGNIGIGGAPDGVQFHDGESGGGFPFDGRISDVAIYNSALSNSELASHASSLNLMSGSRFINRDYEKVIEQINQITTDAHYRGINLLRDESLVTTFNEKGTSLLITEGADFTVDGLGLLHQDFNDLSDIEEILFRIREAKSRVRQFGFSLTNDLNVISIRQNFTESLVNTHLSGADDLTVADQNEEGANLLALQTRQSLATTSLSLASQSQASVLSLFR